MLDKRSIVRFSKRVAVVVSLALVAILIVRLVADSLFAPAVWLLVPVWGVSIWLIYQETVRVFDAIRSDQ